MNLANAITDVNLSEHLPCYSDVVGVDTEVFF